MRFVVVSALALAWFASCGPTAVWKCTDNAGFNCVCNSPAASGDTAENCASYPCCIHYEDGAGLHCACKNLSASTCSSSEVDARKAAGATTAYVVTACPK
jgi:hypothetical protein